MKIRINTDESISETELTITCQKLTPEIDKIIALLRIMNQQIIGMKDNESYVLDTEQILYAETVDKNLFLYTFDGVYETRLKLYELEERLADVGFLRISRSCILNLSNVSSLAADFDRRILVTLDNNEKLIVSRQYADEFKKRLGGVK